MPQNNLLIAFGGVSPEHEVSVLTAIRKAAARSSRSTSRKTAGG